MQNADGRDVCGNHAYVGLDVHKGLDCGSGGSSWTCGTAICGYDGQLAELTKALSHLGLPSQLHVAYEA